MMNEGTVGVKRIRFNRIRFLIGEEKSFGDPHEVAVESARVARAARCFVLYHRVDK
jgi:hypothetical protein